MTSTFYFYAPTKPELVATLAGRRLARRMIEFGLTREMTHQGFYAIGPVSRPYLYWLEPPPDFIDGKPVLTVRVDVRVAPVPRTLAEIAR